MKAIYIILLSFALIGYGQSTNLDAEWEAFKLEYRKRYGDESEELLRKQIFKDNKELIDRHNARYAAGKETYQMGINEFTDMLSEEFTNKMLGAMNLSQFPADHSYVPSPNLELPETVDWRTEHAVTEVKHQGNCGCCWAFAAVATMESHHFLKTRKLVEFSEQNLLDCSIHAPYKNLGCKGGSPQEALRYVKENKGINTRSSYMYEGHEGKCRFKPDHIGVVIQGSVDIKYGDEAALMKAVAEKGPISVTIDAQHLQPYQSGIYNQACSGTAKYHSILLVGYGKDKGHEYWLLKNSWGNWGEAGYFRMARNSNNLCSIANWPVYPLI